MALTSNERLERRKLIAPLSPARHKALSNSVHAKQRAFERYGLALSDQQMAEIVEKIVQGGPDVAWLRPDDKENRLWVTVKWEDQWLPLVYDRTTATLITCLPPHTIDDYRSALEPTQVLPELAQHVEKQREVAAEKVAEIGPIYRIQAYTIPEARRRIAELKETIVGLQAQIGVLDESGGNETDRAVLVSQLKAAVGRKMAHEAIIEITKEVRTEQLYHQNVVIEAKADDPLSLLLEAYRTITMFQRTTDGGTWASRIKNQLEHYLLCEGPLHFEEPQL